MTTISADQLAQVRAQSGDTTATYDVSDLEVQRLFTLAADDLDLTTVYVLRQRLGKAVDEIAVSSIDGMSRQGNQKYDQIERLLKYWEDKAGVAGSKLSCSTFDLNIDADTTNQSTWDGTT